LFQGEEGITRFFRLFSEIQQTCEITLIDRRDLTVFLVSTELLQSY